jgi:hypothetical protein
VKGFIGLQGEGSTLKETIHRFPPRDMPYPVSFPFRLNAGMAADLMIFLKVRDIFQFLWGL